MAVVLSIVFKKDSDVTEFESDLGKMKKHDSDLMPLNTGESSITVSSTLLLPGE